jgi:glycosyltransferase involved in cell wall biosynthesis
MSSPLRVKHLQRRASHGQFSVERLFEDVRRALPADVTAVLRVNRFPSRGVARRLADAVGARRARGEINHVLGDVHYLAWFLPRRKTVITVLDCVSLERMRGAKLGLFWLAWYWWPLRHADRVTVISRYTQESLLRWVDYPRDRIHVIPPPLSAEFTAAPPPPRGARLRLLQVGTGPNKNLPRVIEAAAGLPVHLAIVGRLSDQHRALLARHAVPFDNHVDLGREQLVEQYRRADAVVFASTYEGFGLPIIEAQATGRPVITSRRCSMPEAAGDAALLVDPEDVGELRAAIARCCDDPAACAALVERGFANAAKYRPERIAAQYAEVYRLVAEGG